jgi:hypothetical protein
VLALILVDVADKRELMVAQSGLDKLAVVVGDARLAELVREQRLLIFGRVDQGRGAVVVRLGLDRVLLLEMQTDDAHVETELLFVDCSEGLQATAECGGGAVAKEKGIRTVSSRRG